MSSLSKWPGNVMSGLSKAGTSLVTQLQTIGSADDARLPRWLVYSGLVAGATASACAIYLYLRPITVINILARREIRNSDMKVRYIQGAEYRYCYAERGSLQSTTPSLLLIDGIMGNKLSWLKCIDAFPEGIHVVILELPGQGDSSVPTDGQDVSLNAFSDMLGEFVQLTNLEVVPFHLVGICMGGTVAAMYAASYPRTLSMVSLVSPMMQSPILTDCWQESVAGRCNIFSASTEDIKRNISRNFYDKSQVPTSNYLLRGLGQMIGQKQSFLTRLQQSLFLELSEESQKFETAVSTITTPTQIIFGEEDEIIHVSGASLLEELLPNLKRSDILPLCGHSIHLEQPDMLGNLLSDFHNTTHVSGATGDS